MRLHEIDPYELTTVQECDDAIAHVVAECEQIEEDLRHPADEYTFGWLRSAKNALATGKGLKQRLQNRRADISAEIKHERACRLERMFMDICKETMTKEQFMSLLGKAEDKLQSTDATE